MVKSEEFGQRASPSETSLGTGLAKAVTEAVTGARVAPLSVEPDGRDVLTRLEIDWDGCPGGFDLPGRVEVRVAPCGGYEARLEGADAPFAAGRVQDLTDLPLEVRVGALIRVSDEGLFRTEMGVFGDRSLRASDLEKEMLELPVEPRDAGLSRLRVEELSVEGDEAYFEVVAEVSDLGRLVRTAREAYLEAWWDNTWLPASPREALFELALGSNDNPSPDEMGFEFLEYGETRDEARVREVADREIAEQPGLIPGERVSYEDWLDLTGLDDSFVGDGRTRPGTRDLFEAAIRAVPESDPDPSGPEPG